MSVMPTRNYYLGAIAWLLSIQYYLAQVLAAVHWRGNSAYSWAHNTISDLGNTHCGPYGDRLVCSPSHALMNGSFIMLGLTTIAGALLLWTFLGANRLARFGFGCMAISGIGTIMIGLYPENTISALHITGAALPFIFGNLGMIVLGSSLRKIPALLRGFTIFLGVTGLVALALFMIQAYAGLGIGGMERFVAYPQSIWMIVFGAFLLLAPPSVSVSAAAGTKR